jgi:hypothetical protein
MKQKSFVERDENLIKSYGHLLEGITHHTGDPKMIEYEKQKLAILMDNAVRAEGVKRENPDITLEQLQKEAQTSTGSASTFVRTQMPIIRKVYPSMMARELVSIQPMSQPTTKLFYYDIIRSDDSTSVTADVHTQRNYANNVEYDPNAPTAIKEIQLVITDSSVTATEKKLKAKWTVEAQQDIRAYHGINVEGDLTSALAREITQEWDRTILQDLLDGATGGAATFDQSVPTGITYTDRKVWMETLFEAMIDVDTSIFKKRYRKTNWIVFPAEIAGFIEKMAGFKADPTSVDTKIIATGGRYFMGTMNNRWRCYCDPFFPSNKILMGYNNSSDWMDTAYVFCPYILSYFSDTFTDPNTFQSVRAILSRAARKCVVGDLLGVVTVTGS